MKKKLFCISLYFILAMILSAQTTGGGEFFSGAVTLFNKIYTGFIVVASMGAVLCLGMAFVKYFSDHNTGAAIGWIIGMAIILGFILNAKAIIESMGGSTLEKTQIERIEKGDKSAKKIRGFYPI